MTSQDEEEPVNIPSMMFQAETLYDAWNTSKTEELLTEKVERKKKKKHLEKEKMETSIQRAREAEKYFNKWKKEKDDSRKV